MHMIGAANLGQILMHYDIFTPKLCIISLCIMSDCTVYSSISQMAHDQGISIDIPLFFYGFSIVGTITCALLEAWSGRI